MNLLVSLEADSKLPSSSSLCKNKGLRNKGKGDRFPEDKLPRRQ